MSPPQSPDIETMDLCISDSEPDPSPPPTTRPATIRPARQQRNQAISTSTSSPDNDLLSRLLALQTFGRPPFLMRNLSYVINDRHRARRALWDLRWLNNSTRSASSPRHLTLTLKPSSCRLRFGVGAQLLHPDRPLTKTPESPYIPRIAKLRISLVLHTDTGRVAFGHRAVSLRVWPAEHLDRGVDVEDVAASVVFDLSAAVALLGATPSALSLLLELSSDSPSAKPINTFPSTLRGELLLIDRVLGDKPVPNGRVSVPLRFAPKEAKHAPPKPVGKQPLSKEHLLPISDEEDTSLDRPVPIRAPRVSGKARGKTPATTRQPDATLVLDVQGAVEHAKEALKSPERPRVYVTCSYTSKGNRFWDGIVRHDFVCPWCHRNCYRFRTLLNHFQVEHDEMGFALEGSPGPTSSPTNAHVKGVPFTLKFEVTAAAPNPEERRRKEERRKRLPRIDEKGHRLPDCEEDLEDVYANPKKYPSYAASRSRGRKEVDAEDVQNGLAKVSLKDPDRASCSEADSESTEFDYDDDDPVQSVPEIINMGIGNRCKNCQRPHPAYNYIAVDRKKFCSEFCEIIFKKKMEDDAGIPKENRSPMLDLSSVPRKPSFNYKEKLGHLQLYHVVSFSEAKEEHFDEDDPDSEEEVDHSWRLDLSMERILHLDDATPKEKLLWMMWNKFGHENYPIPSIYAEKYTRYTLELFALEYGREIAAYKLRIQFVGFLRALHIHGLIDTVAILSIMRCLDGKKKRRDCTISTRPEIPPDPTAPRGKPRGATRPRKGCRKNGAGPA